MSERSQGDSPGAAGKSDTPRKTESKSGGKTERGKSGKDIGRVLRTVYDRTLREEVPPDFLDLLGKLG